MENHSGVSHSYFSFHLKTSYDIYLFFLHLLVVAASHSLNLQLEKGINQKNTIFTFNVLSKKRSSGLMIHFCLL